MKKIAVLIPCLNEELTIGRVVRDFRTHLPNAAVYVFDNRSTDRTAAEAEAAGATVIPEMRRGKGFVVQSMFQNVDADIYIMVDGDNTYPASFVHELMQPVLDGTADMTVGARLAAEGSQFRWLNRLGNRFFLGLVNTFLRARLTDILSGYRVMNREFVKSIPLLSGGFEIETELTIKAVQRRFRIVEVPTPLAKRPPGSNSKIRIAQDGLRILGTILSLVRDYKPLTVFGAVGLLLTLIGSGLGLYCLWEPEQMLTAARLRWGVAGGAAFVGGLVSVGIGLMLHVVNRHFLELEYLYTHNHSLKPVEAENGAVVPLPAGEGRKRAA